MMRSGYHAEWDARLAMLPRLAEISAWAEVMRPLMATWARAFNRMCVSAAQATRTLRRAVDAMEAAATETSAD